MQRRQIPPRRQNMFPSVVVVAKRAWQQVANGSCARMSPPGLGQNSGPPLTSSTCCQRKLPENVAQVCPALSRSLFRSLPLSHAAQFDFLSVRAKDALNIALPASVT